MKRTTLVTIAGLLVTLTACAGRHGNVFNDGNEQTNHVVTTWGASNPGTELAWNYQGQPSPPFEGAPERALTQVCFGLDATALDREAMGALRTATEGLLKGGERADLNGVELLVVGFADGDVERAHAEELGLRRAEAAKAQLVTLGVPNERIQVASYGARFSEADKSEKAKLERERSAIVWILK